jgi:protein-L-isoaspartate O-methyltransferase
MRPPFVGGYTDTPDADPIHLYDTVAVALDASRYLNNGEPSGLTAWLDALDIAPGSRFLHIGCGVGHYTAPVAHVVSSEGNVLALEADSSLAEQARKHLAAYVNVEVRCATGVDPADGCFDAIFVNAGATEVLSSWLDRLCDAGRILLPLTTERYVPAIPVGHVGVGHMPRVERQMDSYAAPVSARWPECGAESSTRSSRRAAFLLTAQRMCSRSNSHPIAPPACPPALAPLAIEFGFAAWPPATRCPRHQPFFS